MPADLVVSALTGLGTDVRDKASSGYIEQFLMPGGQRNFEAWQVDDEANGRTMREFYSTMLGQRLPGSPAAYGMKLRLAIARTTAGGRLIIGQVLDERRLEVTMSAAAVLSEDESRALERLWSVS